MSRTEEERERARLEREQRRRAVAAPEPQEPAAPEPHEAAAPEPHEAAAPEPDEAATPSPPVGPGAPERLRAGGAPNPRVRWGARALALVALVVVGVVVWLLVRSPSNDPPRKPVIPPRIVRIVIPEGFTRAQIALRAKADGLRGSYLAASLRSPELSPARYGAPAGTPHLEGFLFPATYELYAGSSARRLVEEQLQAFHENFGGAEIHRARALGIAPYQLLTVASMIEREALLEHDRPLIAAVIYNRLHAGMPLGIDATIRYALDDFTQPLTEAQLHSNSPYNTRLHTGLPPTPIANPGLASIAAAAHPAHVPYLYYVAGADGCGEMVFSTSFAQFERNAAAYREAIAKNGGRVPTCHRR